MSDRPSVVGWDEERARRWLNTAGDRERQLEPVSDALFEAADLQPGERVLDVGCGTGPTTVRAARLVGTDVGDPQGRVVGTDLSPTLIEAASLRPQPDGIEWVVADAQTHDFGAGAFDLVLSRMGVMFFPDPMAAFANLATACRPGGRLALAVWRRREDSPVFGVPYAEVVAALARMGADYTEPPADAAQFSLATAGPDLLGAAGWSEVTLRPDDRRIYVSGPGDPAHVAAGILELGPSRVVTEDQPPEVIAELRRHLTRWAAERHDGAGVPLPGGFLIITARRP